MKLDSPEQTAAELDGLYKEARDFLRPKLEAILAEHGDNRANLREPIIKLVMMLGMSMAILAAHFWEEQEPEEFGKQMGVYVGTAIKDIKIIHNKLRGKDGKPSTETKSVWDSEPVKGVH